MENTKFTPGPRIARYDDYSGTLYVKSADGRYLASVHNLHDGKNNEAREIEAKANLNLYAAAPELLEALVSITNEYEQVSKEPCSGWNIDKDPKYLAAKAAIAKATA